LWNFLEKQFAETISERSMLAVRIAKFRPLRNQTEFSFSSWTNLPYNIQRPFKYRYYSSFFKFLYFANRAIHSFSWFYWCPNYGFRLYSPWWCLNIQLEQSYWKKHSLISKDSLWPSPSDSIHLLRDEILHLRHTPRAFLIPGGYRYPFTLPGYTRTTQNWSWFVVFKKWRCFSHASCQVRQVTINKTAGPRFTNYFIRLIRP